MLEAAVRADLVSGEQMTERKLALVCQSRVALLCAAGWRGRCACWLMSKAVLLAVLLVAGWSGAGSLVPFQSRVWMSQTHVAVSLQAGKTTVVLHRARGWYSPCQLLLAVCSSRGSLSLPLMCLLLCWSRAVGTGAGRCSWEQLTPLFLCSERQTSGQVLFITSNSILSALLLNSVYI